MFSVLCDNTVCSPSRYRTTVKCVSFLLRRALTHVVKDEGADVSYTSRSRRWRSKSKHLLLICFFPTQCANGSLPPGDKINKMRSSFFNSEYWTASRRSVAKQYSCCGTGKGEDQWDQCPQLYLIDGEIFESKLRMQPGRATRRVEMMSARSWSMSTETFFFFFLLSVSSDGNQ